VSYDDGAAVEVALRPLHPELPDLYLQSNQAGGDCQFWAFAQSLNAYSGVAVEQLRHHFSSLGLDLGFITNVDLRALAYKMFLLPHPELDTHLHHWKLMASDPSLAGVYDHALFLKDKRIDLLTRDDRKHLFTTLMNPVVTWGDETSLMILEKLLRVRVDVITGTYLQTRDVKDTSQEPLIYIAMNLQFQHYESVVHNKDAVYCTAWSKPEIPDVIVQLHRNHCSTAVQPHIRMDAEWIDSMAAALQLSSAVIPDTFLLHYKACSQVDFTMTDILRPAEEAMLDADGGWQHPGDMLDVVHMLQCGLRVAVPVFQTAASLSVPVAVLANAAMPRLF
jgi:hypothetical protein